MRDLGDLYPPNPQNVSPDLTVPNNVYRLRVFIVLASLVVFVLLYLFLVAGSAYASYLCFTELSRPQEHSDQTIRYARRERRNDKDSDGVFFFGGIASALLFLFLVKGLFKWRQADPDLRIEINDVDQPELCAFIRTLCRDAKAPLPRHIYVTPEVNAFVSYPNSLLSLFVPTSKNLTIGLGLVNFLNLTEFKAVLAHEFGHFSQSSMKLGAYVYMANRIVADIVYNRDWLDRLLGSLCRSDVRIAFFAWIFTALLWVLRKILEGMFCTINFANSALSRQMEFNADLVAVSVTGSDAIVFALSRLTFASRALDQAWYDLTVAADHKIYTRDVYVHQTAAADFLRAASKDPNLGIPPELPADPTAKVRVFEPGSTGIPPMWQTHPSNFEREENAKRIYIRSLVDNRPAWIIFRQPEKLREEMTRRIYEFGKKLKDVAFSDPEVVQRFIDSEHAETTYDPKYHGLYDQRFLNLNEDDLSAIEVAETTTDRAALLNQHAKLYTENLKDRIAAFQRRQAENSFLNCLVAGMIKLTEKDFPFRDGRYKPLDAPRLLETVDKELKEDEEYFSALDREVLQIHRDMAQLVGGELRTELVSRYRFHTYLQKLIGDLRQQLFSLQAMLNSFAGRSEITKEEFLYAQNRFAEADRVLSLVLTASNSSKMPSLKNVEAGTLLRTLLCDAPLSPFVPKSNSIDFAWLNAFMDQLSAVIGRAERIHFKSLGGILSLQERIADEFRAQMTPKPETETGPAAKPAALLADSESTDS